MAGYREARLYAYSNARVKAMESKLIPRSTMDELAKLDSIEPILARLLQTSYSKSIEEYGGAQIRGELVDFALSSDLAKSLYKLERVTPAPKKKLILLFISKFEISNVKLMLDAKAKQRRFEDIERYLVETGHMSKALMRDAFQGERDVESLAAKMARSMPYKELLSRAMSAYGRSKDVLEAENEIDKQFYEMLSGSSSLLWKTSPEAAKLIKNEIEMKNMLTLLRAKRYGLTEQEVASAFIGNGITSGTGLMALFRSSKGVDDLATSVKSFDLKEALRLYQQSKGTQMLRFEIAMRNSLFRMAMHLLRHSVLSFGTLAGYAYIKEMEVFALRTLVEGKQHGLSSAEVGELITWNK
jgi:V/A-type H+-transporting ATPase subunit C